MKKENKKKVGLISINQLKKDFQNDKYENEFFTLSILDEKGEKEVAKTKINKSECSDISNILYLVYENSELRKKEIEKEEELGKIWSV